MTRILKVRNLTSPKTPRKVTGVGATDRISGSKHDPQQLTGRVTSKRSIKRLMVKDPMNAPLERDVVNEFTNNPNPKFDPSRAPGAVQIKKIARAGVGTVRAGHQKVITYNRQMRIGGKTLRRRG